MKTSGFLGNTLIDQDHLNLIAGLLPPHEHFIQDSLKTRSYRYIPSRQLSRQMVERIANDSEMPEKIATQFKRVLSVADSYKLPAYRILFILWADGLKVWID